MFARALLFAGLALLFQAVHSENVPLELILDADSTVVHYIRGACDGDSCSFCLCYSRSELNH